MLIVHDKASLKKLTDEAELLISNYEDNLVQNTKLLKSQQDEKEKKLLE